MRKSAWVCSIRQQGGELYHCGEPGGGRAHDGPSGLGRRPHLPTGFPRGAQLQAPALRGDRCSSPFQPLWTVDRKVNFNEAVTLRILDEDTEERFDFSISHPQLQHWMRKPWRLEEDFTPSDLGIHSYRIQDGYESDDFGTDLNDPPDQPTVDGFVAQATGLPQVDLSEDVIAICVTQSQEQTCVRHILSYGLHVEHLGRRSWWSSATTPAQFENEIREHWMDWRPFFDSEVILVTPQHHEGGELKILVVFQRQRHQPRGHVPCLLRCAGFDDDMVHEDFLAIYLPSDLMRSTLLGYCPVPEGWRYQVAGSVVRFGAQILGDHAPLAVPPGAHITALFDAQWIPLDDAVSFLHTSGFLFGPGLRPVTSPFVAPEPVMTPDQGEVASSLCRVHVEVSYFLFGVDDPLVSYAELLLPRQISRDFLCQISRIPFLHGLQHGGALVQHGDKHWDSWEAWHTVLEGDHFEIGMIPESTSSFPSQRGAGIQIPHCLHLGSSTHSSKIPEDSEADDKERLRVGLQCFIEDQQDSIALYTHGLLQVGLGQRVGDLHDLTPTGVYRLTRQLWPEHQHLDLWLVVVRPQVQILPDHPQLHIIAEFSSQYVRRPPQSCPIIVESWFWDQRLNVRHRWLAHYLECTCSQADFRRILGREDLHLDIWIESRHLQTHVTTNVRPGSLVMVSMEPVRLPELRHHQGLRNAADLPRLVRAARHNQGGSLLHIALHAYNQNGTTCGSKNATIDGILAINPHHIAEKAKVVWADLSVDQIWLVPDPAFGVAGELHVLVGPQVDFGTPILCAVDIRDTNQGRITPRYVLLVVPWHFTVADFCQVLQLEALQFPSDSELQLVQHASLLVPIRRLSQGQSPYLIITVPSTGDWLERRLQQMHEDTVADEEDGHVLLQLDHSRKANGANGPLPLSLLATLGSAEEAPQENLEAQRVDAPPLDFSAIYDEFQRFDTHCILTCFYLTPMFGWHPRSYPWVDLDWWDPTSALVEIHIYTDGSECTTGTGAAFCAFGWTGSQWVLVGYFSQQLAKEQQAHHAEDFALMAAFKTIYDMCKMQHYQGLPMPSRLVCHFDSMSAGGKACGNFTAHTNQAVAHSSRAILHLLQSAFGMKVFGFHVRGHTGDPGNEIANTLAEEAARGRPTHDVDQLLQDCAEDCLRSALPWFWVLFLKFAFRVVHPGQCQ